MKTLKNCTLLFLLIGASLAASAQDLMYLRGQKQPKQVKVTELGIDEIKYYTWPVVADAPVQVIPKQNITKLVLKSGETYFFSEDPMADPNNYEGQGKYALKFNFLAPLYSHSVFTFEKSIRPGRSIETSLGIIGLGVQYDQIRSSGLYCRVGYKFITGPDYYARGLRYAHILKGSYIKPEVIFGGYTVERDRFVFSSSSSKRSVVFGGVMINFGKQWVIDDAWLFDLYFGVGYGTSNYSSTRHEFADHGGAEAYHYAFLGGVDVFPIAISAGFKVGFVFGRGNTQAEK